MIFYFYREAIEMPESIHNLLHKGSIYCFVLAGIASWLGPFFPLFGKAIFGLLLGMICHRWLFHQNSQKGISFCGKTILKWAVMLMGIRLSFGEILSVGSNMFYLILLSITSVLFTGFICEKIQPHHSSLIRMISFGTAICGSAAIAATSPFIKAKKEDIALSIAIVNIVGLFGVFFIPLLATILHFDSVASGLWIGSTLQAVGHVAATGEIIGQSGGNFAMVTKMGRVACLLPLLMWLGFSSKDILEKETENAPSNWTKKIQDLWYLWGFVFFIALSSYPALSFIKEIASYTLVVAMVGIGLSINIKDIFGKESLFAFSYALLLWMIQIVFCGILVSIL